MSLADAYFSIGASCETEPRVVNASIDDHDFQRGAWVDLDVDSPLIFEIELPDNATRPPHYLGHRVLVVSDLFLATLAQAGIDNFQTWPAILRCSPSGTEWAEYSLFNVVGLLDAVDREASAGEVLMEKGGVELCEFLELVISRPRAFAADFFRLASDPAIVIMKGRVYQVLLGHVPDTGWGFTATEVETTE